MLRFAYLTSVAGAFTLMLAASSSAQAGCPDWLNHTLGKLHSQDSVDICSLTADKPVLIVNTASHCAFTSQFKGLEALHQKYKDRGLVVLGVPSDDFYQAADSAEEAANVCFVNYGVTFTMTNQQHVRGRDAHPIFRHLASTHDAPGWNFNKYLVNKEGQVVEHFGSMTKPDSAKLNTSIEKLLSASN